ncbi:MAG: hypothetical protein K2P81_01285 [Bacteriovoracaceae bacterium]|nr:hypothetical protein [Bacteriovoracaceae bacterium]
MKALLLVTSLFLVTSAFARSSMIMGEFGNPSAAKVFKALATTEAAGEKVIEGRDGNLTCKRGEARGKYSCTFMLRSDIARINNFGTEQSVTFNGDIADEIWRSLNVIQTSAGPGRIIKSFANMTCWVNARIGQPRTVGCSIGNVIAQGMSL